MSVEHESYSYAPEAEAAEYFDRRHPRVQEREKEILAHLKDREVPLNAKNWEALIPAIRISNNLREEIGLTADLLPKRLFAYVHRDGTLSLDEEKFMNLSPEKQRHTFYHEAAHRLDFLLSGHHIEEMEELDELVESLPPEEISYYVHHMAERHADHPEIKQIIRHEAGPELIAQYLESDGTFRGMLEAKYLLAPEAASGWEGVESAETLMSELDGFDDLSEDEQIDFFEDHPNLVPHFRIYANLQSVFADQEMLDDITTEWTVDYDYDYYEEEELYELPPPPPPPQTPLRQLPAKPANKFDFYSWLRGKEEGSAK